MKKTASLILACIFALSLFTSCADSGKQDETTPSAVVDTTVAPDETTSEFDSKGYLKDSLPTMNFGDKEFNILYWSDREHEEFVAEEQSGEAVNDAIFTRNTTIENRAGVKLNFVGEKGNANNTDGFTNKVKAVIDGGEKDFDMIGTYSMTAGKLAVEGFLSDLKTMDYLDWKKPWWPDSLIEDATIKGKLFFASGDISANVIYMMYVTFFNRQMVTDRNLDDPYELVKKGTWTIDKMFELCNGIYEDSDGNGSPSIGDTYGQYAYTLHLDVFLQGSGVKVIDPSSDELVISEEFLSDKVGDIVSKVGAFFHMNDRAYLLTSNSTVHQWFSAQKSLVWNDRCRDGTTFKTNEVPFGIIPNPKYDTDQDKYYTLLGNPISIYCIPCDVNNEAMSAYVMELYASESYRNVSPALYEINMKYRFTDDATSSEMYDLIRSSVVFDLGRIFAKTLNTPFTTFQQAITNNTAWSISVKANSKTSWKKGIESINVAFD
ncbi:MAG: hypothetical protein MJ137_06415 [Clostridia bacterium]|nr:hypothetical protein [Clostridia bacterium]